MEPFWICGTNVRTTHRELFCGLYHCAKFGWNRFSRFDNAKVNILRLWLENDYSHPVLVVFGTKIGENGNVLHFYPYRFAITQN